MKNRRTVKIISALLIIVSLLIAGTAVAQPDQTTREWTEVICTVEPGETRKSGNSLHVKGDIQTGLAVSEAPLIAGTNTTVSDYDLNLRKGTGEGRGSLSVELDSIDGSWEGHYHVHFDDFSVSFGHALSEGTGELNGTRLRTTFRQIPLSDVEENPCPDAPLRAYAVRGVLTGDLPSVAPSSPDDNTSADVSFDEVESVPFGVHGGVEFVRYTGFFEGETSLGAFRMPYEIVAPADPALSNGSVLVEPPHFLIAPIGRDVLLGQGLVFDTVSGYASVGFGEHGMNVLDPAASPLLLAGEPIANPGAPNPTGILDEEILIQFSQALRTSSYAQTVLGAVERLYAYGYSQSASTLLETQRNAAQRSQQDLFDFTLLHLPLWGFPFGAEGEAFDFLSGDFEPVDDVGKVIFIETESELVNSDAEQFREVLTLADHRLYEIAGADHTPLQADNSLDETAVMRAMWLAGDRWARTGAAPAPNAVIEQAPAGTIDPVYGEETGIARDGNLNARGGVRLPDLAVGRAQFIAVDPTTTIPNLPPQFNILSGNMVDLACEPAPGSNSDQPRFRNHGEYVSAFVQQVDQLQQQGFLLEADAEALKQGAAESDVGKPGTCSE